MLRQICRRTSQHPSNALFYFPKEKLTGIAPTRKITEKDLDFTVGMAVTFNWEGKLVEAEILALDGKSGFFSISVPFNSYSIFFNVGQMFTLRNQLFLQLSPGVK